MEFGLLINTRQLQTYSLELNSEELMKNLAIAVLMALMCVAALSYGQAIDANLVGTVVDASGSAVPNANIEIRQPRFCDRRGVRQPCKARCRGGRVRR